MAGAIYGLYAHPDEAQRAVDSLLAAGISDPDIAIVSSEPYDEHAFGRRDRHTPMPWLAAAGGLAGGVSGYCLALLTQKTYPIITGGMPITPLWTNGIITYELTMLGAILTTLAILLVSARLPDWRAQLYDPAVSDGYILIGTVNPPDESRAKLHKVLRESGAVEVKEAVLS